MWHILLTKGLLQAHSWGEEEGDLFSPLIYYIGVCSAVQPLALPGSSIKAVTEIQNLQEQLK